MASNMEDSMIPEMEMEIIRKDLLRKSVKGEWAGVIDIYEKHPHAHKAKLTRNEDTALHMAVSNDKQETVKQLMNIISSHHEEGKEAPEIKNRQGNTPLHVAASMGSEIMCESIAGTCQLGSSFIAARNCKGETPLFLAVLCGKKDAFLYLHNLCQKYKLNGYDFSWRSDDDDTILHAAITVERFDLAFQIIHLYPKLVDSINKQGFSPLHLLADKPSAFESATIFALIADYIIYRVTIRSKQKRGHTNLENPEIQNVPHERGHQGILTVPKQKHKWVTQVMNELVERTLVYELARGTNPDMIIRFEMLGDRKTPIFGNNKVSIARETPILIAAKNGITKMVEKILENFPEAVYDLDPSMKNIVLLSVEHKQCDVYELLLNKKKKKVIPDSVFWEVDKEGNTALHLAAKVANSNTWPVPGAAFQMNWEIKWFEHVQRSMPEWYPFLCNKAGETPREVFTKSHEGLVKQGQKWLTSISEQACPIATGLFVAVAFSTSSNDGFNFKDPKLQGVVRPSAFSYSLLVPAASFFFSVVAVFCFLLMICSSYSESSFRTGNRLMVFLLGYFHKHGRLVRFTDDYKHFLYFHKHGDD
ncbi:uncharacterized protein LOC109022261 isoform X3 [Juglans regia]|uniref:Uncharacterized protein LOC109022261 isoform X3 n=1 Tax=Juglans regia TaxID=51240 RepID=A0A6P9F2G5_JUGRE|nr:uncharacterized protein LOC109022261 isoform X3 [Juglans regia]